MRVLPLGRVGNRTLEKWVQAFDPSRHQRRHVDPKGVVTHLDWLAELKDLISEMEHESSERPLVPIKEWRRLAPQDAVERRKPLLPVEEQLDSPERKLPAAPMGRRLRPRDPYQQAAHGMAAIERRKKGAHLIPVPDKPALELRQSQRAGINAGKDV